MPGQENPPEGSDANEQQATNERNFISPFNSGVPR